MLLPSISMAAEAIRFVFAELDGVVRHEDRRAPAPTAGGVRDECEDPEVVGEPLVLLALVRQQVVLLHARGDDGVASVTARYVFEEIFILSAELETVGIFADDARTVLRRTGVGLYTFLCEVSYPYSIHRCFVKGIVRCVHTYV